MLNSLIVKHNFNQNSNFRLSLPQMISPQGSIKNYLIIAYLNCLVFSLNSVRLYASLKKPPKECTQVNDSRKEIAPFTGRTMTTMSSAGQFQRRLGPTTIASFHPIGEGGNVIILPNNAFSKGKHETPWLILVCLKEKSRTKTSRDLSDYCELTQPSAVSAIPMTCSRLCSRMLWSAESKAALRSTASTETRSNNWIYRPLSENDWKPVQTC